MTEELSPAEVLDPSARKIILTGCVLGAVLSFLGVTFGMHALGAVWASALGLGLFVAFWGGLGFGAMVGGVVYATRLEQRMDHGEPARADA